MTTPFQPTLPAEVPFTDAELAFIDDSPPGLFPENQNSNFGLLRKIYCDFIQDLVEIQNTLYNERFVETSTVYLEDWERMMGLPTNPAGQTVAQRRAAVLGRVQRGPFTRARRAEIVERYISAVMFGSPLELTPAGIPLSAGGVPLYAEPGSVASSYSIRENQPTWRNLTQNPNFENDVTHWTGTQGSFVQSAAQNKFGTKSGLWTATSTLSSAGVTSDYTYAGVTPGKNYVASAYLRRGTGNRTMSVLITWYTSANAFISAAASSYAAVSNSSFTRLNYSLVAPATAAKATVAFSTNNAGGSIGDSFYIDGVQFEEGTTPTNFKDNDKTPFYYEVRYLSSLGIDAVGMNRELKRITPAGIQFDSFAVTDL